MGGGSNRQQLRQQKAEDKKQIKKTKKTAASVGAKHQLQQQNVKKFGKLQESVLQQSGLDDITLNADIGAFVSKGCCSSNCLQCLFIKDGGVDWETLRQCVRECRETTPRGGDERKIHLHDAFKLTLTPPNELLENSTGKRLTHRLGGEVQYSRILWVAKFNALKLGDFFMVLQIMK